MRLILRGGGEELELLARDQVLEPRGEAAAEAVLAPLLADPVNAASARRALAETGGDPRRWDGRDLLRQLARRVAAGELRLVRRRRFDVVAPSAGAAESATPRQAAASAPSPAPAPAAAPAAAAAEETADALLAGTDQEAQAATLVAAADSGAPLCDT